MHKAAWFLVGGLVAPLLACGTSGTSVPTPAGGAMDGGSGSGGGGAGGGAGTFNDAGNVTGGSGAAGGTSPLGDTLAEACIAYALAVCRRNSECFGGNGDDCLGATWRCPDLTSSPGSTRTVEGLKECAETYETLPCDQVEAAILPPCVTPGELAQGDACLFSSQCSTLSCKLDPGTGCGKCARQAGIGESCAADDVVCAAGSICEAQECVAMTSPPEVGSLAGPNEPCDLLYGCVEDYYCPTGTLSPVCTASPMAGEACVPLTICSTDTYCVENALGERVCTPRPGLGEPCALALDSPIEEPYICQEDLLCSYTSSTVGTCLPLPQAGEPCNIPPSNPTYGRCEGGLHCNFAVDPPVCGGLGRAGEACEIDGDCEQDLRCGCLQSAPDCDPHVCLTHKLGGQACGADAASSCHPAFDCTAGTCQPGALRGAFADACGG